MCVAPNRTCTGVICVASSRVVYVQVMEMVSTVNINNQQPAPDGQSSDSDKRPQYGIHIATLLNTDGEARILFEFEDVHLQIMPDTCAQIALQLLSAVYASRAEQALFKYAQDNLIDPDTLVRFVRS